MAQVKKFKNGNVLKYKRGNIVLNGQVIAKGDEITDDYLNNILGGTLLGGQWVERINNGENLHIDDVEGGVNSNFGIEFGDSKKDNRRERRFAKASSYFEHENVSRARHDLDVIRKRLHAPAQKDPDTYDLSEDIHLKIGEDGKIIKDADYSKAINRIKWLRNLNNSGIDFNTAKLNYGNRKHTWDTIRNNSLLANMLDDPDAWDEHMKEMANDYGIIIGKPKEKDGDKKYDPQDIDKDGVVSDDEKKLAKAKAQYTAAGLNFDKHSPYVVFDDSGNMLVTQLFDQTIGKENAAFNDFWRKSKSWLPDNDWLYGYSRYGNRLYKTSDVETEGSELHRLLSNAGFYNMNMSDNYSGANQVFKYLWDTPDEWNTYNANTSYWVPVKDSGTNLNGLKYRSGNGLYTVDGQPEGTQILEYYDPRASRDDWGRPMNYLYGLFDADGNWIANVDSSKLAPIQNGEQLAFNGIQKRIYDPSNTAYHGRIQKSYNDDKGNYIKTYYKPGEDMIVEMSDFDKWNQLGNGNQAFRIPVELVEIINRNPNFWDNLLKSSSRERFIATLRDAVSNRISEAIPFVTEGYSDGNNWAFGSKEKDLGFTEEDLAAYMAAMSKLGKRNGLSTNKREYKYLFPLYRPVEKKLGGGLIGTTVKDNTAPKTVKVENSKDINKAAGTDNQGMSWDSLTSADKMQLASIVLDLGALVGGPVGTISGVGGTVAQFVADVKRDGLDWGDVGYGVLGLGLDALSLIPGGAAAKLGKVGKNIKKVAPIIKGLLLTAGAADGVKGLNNILSGDYSMDDFRSVANGLMAAQGIRRKIGEVRASKLKEVAAPETVKPKTADDFKKEYIDDFVKNNPGATKYNGEDVDWFDSSTGRITDYKKAEEGLKTLENFKVKEGVAKIKATYDKILSAAKNMSAGIWGSKNNLLSDNFRWRSSNRTLGSTPEEIIEAYIANPNAVARLANIDEGIANELRSAGLKVETNPYVRAKIYDGTRLTLFKSGGSIKKYFWGGSTVKGLKDLNLGHQFIDLARHVNAYKGREAESKLKEKSINAANYSNVIPQYDQLSSTSGLGTLMQRRNAEAQALSNAYASVPKTSDYTQYLSLANSRAANALNSDRLLNLDINNQLTNNERARLQQSNAYKSQVAQIIGDERRRNAATQSALWQERAGKVAGDVAQVEAGLEQMWRYYNQHENLRSAAKQTEEQLKIDEEYYTKANEIQNEINAAAKTGGTDFWGSEQHKLLKDKLEALKKVTQSKLARIQIQNTMSPWTGEYFSVNLPDYNSPVAERIPGRIIKVDKKGGRINRSAKEINNDRILKNIEADNKRIIQLNENILKLLMTALK